MSHPVGTLHRWSSSHHVLCCTPPLRVTLPLRRTAARGPRSWHCCAATRALARASIQGWPAGCAPGSRMPPTTSSWRGGEHAPPLFLGPRQLLDSYDEAGGENGPHRGDGRDDRLVLSRLVHTLLRQLVQTGEIQDPLGDALDALRAAGDEAEVREIEAFPASARTALTEALSLHAHNLTGLVPRFAPGWMPRTNDRVRDPTRWRSDRPARGVRPRRRTAPAAHRIALRTGPVHRRAVGGGAAVPALSVAARNSPYRHSPVPAGAPGVGLRPLRRRGCT